VNDRMWDVFVFERMGEGVGFLFWRGMVNDCLVQCLFGKIEIVVKKKKVVHQSVIMVR